MAEQTSSFTRGRPAGRPALGSRPECFCKVKPQQEGTLPVSGAASLVQGTGKHSRGHPSKSRLVWSMPCLCHEPPYLRDHQENRVEMRPPHLRKALGLCPNFALFL